jgi:hypothetical protein
MDKKDTIIPLKFFNKPGLIIKPEGIIRSTVTGKHMINWEEIKDYSVVKTNDKAFMLLFVDDPQHFLDEANWFAKFGMKWNMRRYKTPLLISATYLQCSFEELKAAILEGMKNAALTRRAAKQ